jgi:hypothetical protein
MVSGCGLIVLLTTAFYFPALVLHRTLVFGDITTIDLPFFEFFARVIKGQASPLWSTQIWGGHPLFAEGQGAFAHPLNIVWAAVVTPIVGPIYSMNLFYWLLKIIGGIGVMGLCRTLGASFWASTFAALAVIFSGIWAHEQYVLPVFQTLTWIPWVLWAMEVWLKRPSLHSAALFGAALSLVILSGYPQGLHGTIIYAVVTILIVPFQAGTRNEWVKSWRKRATLLLVVGAIAVGLSFVQLFPLFELVGLSHRSTGIGIAFAGLTPLTTYVRGLLVTDFGPSAATGSLLVCILASCTLFLPMPDRIKGHMLAAFVLLILGWERATPIFRFFYDHGLLPGLGYFRQTTIYIGIASIGIAVSAAFAIDRLSKWEFQPRNGALNARPPVRSYASYARYAILAAFWIWALSSLRLNWILAVHIAVTIAAGTTLFFAIKMRKRHLIAPALTLVLTIEVLALRLHPFDFFPSNVFVRPPGVAAIETVPDWRDYKVMDVGFAGLTAFLPADEPDYIFGIRKAVAAIAPLTNMRWELPSMAGNLALELRRRTAVEDILHDEIFGTIAGPPGLRLIDLLGVRFVTSGGELRTPGFRTLYFDQRYEIQTRGNKMQAIEENEAALPRFQLYSRWQTVDTLDAAISAIKNLKTRMLVIEDPDRRSLRLPSPESVDDSDDESAHIEVRKATDTEYRLTVSATKPQWLFIADANYPGWTAKLDGRNVPVFSAQALGKAIEIPPGDHDVILKFKSKTFYIGLLISMFTVTILVFDAVFLCRKRQLSTKIVCQAQD